MYLKWLEQNFDFKESNSLIEKIKQMPDDYIDTDPKQFYEDLEWSDSQHRIKGI